jgi:hypothetical protein
MSASARLIENHLEIDCVIQLSTSKYRSVSNLVRGVIGVESTIQLRPAEIEYETRVVS